MGKDKYESFAGIILELKISMLAEVMDFLKDEWGDTDDIEALFDELKELLKQKYGGDERC